MDTSAEGVTTTGTRATNFYNPETLKNNHWLHTWKVLSTSPFKQAVVFTKNVTPAVSSITVTPSTATVNAGQTLGFSATVATTGFANKAVTWSIYSDGTTGDVPAVLDPLTGVLTIPANYVTGALGAEVVVKATSVFDTTKSASATVTVVNGPES